MRARTPRTLRTRRLGRSARAPSERRERASTRRIRREKKAPRRRRESSSRPAVRPRARPRRARPSRWSGEQRFSRRSPSRVFFWARGATASGETRARRRGGGTNLLTRAEPRGRGWTSAGTRAARRCFTDLHLVVFGNAGAISFRLALLRTGLPRQPVVELNSLFPPPRVAIAAARVDVPNAGSSDHERAFKHDARDASVQVRAGARRFHPRARRDRVSPRVIFSTLGSFPSRSRLV